MKLHYFHDPEGNFGDDLNPWLWPRLLPRVLDDDGHEVFVGIGTLLNHRLPAAPIKHVFGSGLGYGRPPRIDGRYVFHAVRGHDTARALGLAPETAITDAAVLVRTVPRPAPGRDRFRVGFIPTGQSIRNADWQSLCTELGWCWISCHFDVERVLTLMQQCDVLVCEAMHGAIVADALRIPWVPVTCNKGILAAKWQDWLGTVGLQYEPTHVTELHDGDRGAGAAVRARNGVKRVLKSAGVWSGGWGEPPPLRSSAADRDAALRTLAAAADRAPFLSADAVIDRHTSRYLELLDRFRRSVGASPVAARVAAVG